MLIFQREIKKKIIKRMFDNRVIIIFGPRQTGKTTLIKTIARELGNKAIYLDCEIASVRDVLKVGQPELLFSYIKDFKVVFLDEAQTIEYIGNILKAFVDTYPEIQVIATGSSSFELANRLGEPLTGRSYEYMLFPLSVREAEKAEIFSLERALRFGLYPAIISVSDELALERLRNLSINYLFKDIFTFEALRKPKLVEDLLKLLAHQIGSQVSLNELAQSLGTSKQTIERYLDLLEKSFIVKRIYSFSRNKRNELRKSFKVYFFDLGIRNLLVGDLTALPKRNDLGQLFENFFIMERIKFHNNLGHYVNFYFWRTYDGREIDLVEEFDNKLSAFECKWSNFSKKTSLKSFSKMYLGSQIFLITKDNYKSFI